MNLSKSETHIVMREMQASKPQDARTQTRLKP